ncbi:MAG: type II toxin-antitoxin system VapC family toxin [Limnohabitans sp.]
MKLVVDNSVAMRWLFADGSKADRLYASNVAALVETCEVHVPSLFVTEAANVISRALKTGVITPQDCESRFDLLHAMQVNLDPVESTHTITSLAMRAFELRLSAYDASYLLLAKKLACPLATLDKDLRRAAKKYRVPIAGVDA